MKAPLLYSGMASFLQFITTPTVDCPGTLMMLQFGKRRYLIGNFVEGTERIRTELNVTRKTVEEVFITGPARWNNLAGLVNVLMTMAERKTVAINYPSGKNYRPKLSTLEDHPRSMQIFGPPNTSHFLASLRRFVFKRNLPLDIVEVHEDGHGDIHEPIWKDQYLEVWAMAIPATKNHSDSKQRKHGICEADVPGSLKRKHAEMDESQKSVNSTGNFKSPGLRSAKAVVKDMFNSNWKPNAYNELHIKEVEMPARIFVRNPETKAIEPYLGPYPGGEHSLPDINVLVRKQWPASASTKLPPPLPSDDAISYFIKSRNQRGKFQVDIADNLGLEKAERGLLVRGHDVITKNGNKVTPDMVLGKSIQGGGVAVIDLPTVQYIDALINRGEFKDSNIMKGIGAFIWILGSGVSSDTRLKRFIKEMNGYEHIVSSSDCCPNRLIMSSVSAATAKYSQMDSQRFKLPYYDNIQIPQRSLLVPNPPKADDCLIDGAIPAKIGLRLQIDPKVSIQDDFVHPPLDLQRVLQIRPNEASDLGGNVRKAIEEDVEAIRSWREDVPSPDAEIITLGTGSATPAKYRNVSATLIRVPGYGSYLLDCGEGTLGSLQRMYVPDELSEILKDLRMIWISHQHVDHHHGLIPLIAAWNRITKGNLVGSNSSSNAITEAEELIPVLRSEENRLAIIADEFFLNFLKEYAKFEDYGLSRTMPVTMHHANFTINRPTMLRWEDTRIPVAKYEQLFGFSDIEAIPVEHCRGARALVLTFPTGFKVAFSGDCRPSRSFAMMGQGATVLIHEATFAHNRTADAVKKRHSTTSEALQVGASMKAKAVVLTHFSQRYSRLPIMEDTEDMKEVETLPAAVDNALMKDNIAGNIAKDKNVIEAGAAISPEGGEDEDGIEMRDDDNEIINEICEVDNDDDGDNVVEEDQEIWNEEDEVDEGNEENPDAEIAVDPADGTTIRETNTATYKPPRTDPSSNSRPFTPMEKRRGKSRPQIPRFHRPAGMKVCVAFDYMRVKVGDIVEMEKYTPALEQLAEITSRTYGVTPLQTGPLNIQKTAKAEGK